MQWAIAEYLIRCRLLGFLPGSSLIDMESANRIGAERPHPPSVWFPARNPGLVATARRSALPQPTRQCKFMMGLSPFRLVGVNVELLGDPVAFVSFLDFCQSIVPTLDIMPLLELGATQVPSPVSSPPGEPTLSSAVGTTPDNPQAISTTERFWTGPPGCGHLRGISSGDRIDWRQLQPSGNSP